MIAHWLRSLFLIRASGFEPRTRDVSASAVLSAAVAICRIYFISKVAFDALMELNSKDVWVSMTNPTLKQVLRHVIF